jgi:hypothetical protein
MERQGEYKSDPTSTFCNKRVVFAGTWFDFMVLMIEASTHLHERLGTQEIDPAGATKILNACRLPEDPRCACFEYVGDNPYCPIHGGQESDLGARFTVSGGEVMQIDPDEPSDEEIPF